MLGAISQIMLQQVELAVVREVSAGYKEKSLRELVNI